MNTIRGRILISFGVLVIMFTIVTLISRKFLTQASEIRGAQVAISKAESSTLRLINTDIELRTKDIIKPEFYRNLNYTSERDDTYDAICASLDGILADQGIGLFNNQSSIGSLHHRLHQYDSLHKQLVALLRERGFKDEGLEGRMRENIHELENYGDVFQLSLVLSLRRHEKDYFLRDDLNYVRKLNTLSNEMLTELTPVNTRQEEAFRYLVNYTDLFNEVVDIESQIGNDRMGLISVMNTTQQEIQNSFDQLVKDTNTEADRQITNLVRYYALLILASVLVATVIGYSSANYVSKSITMLANSMKEAIASGFKSNVAKPRKRASIETKSLYKSYQNLIQKIRSQLIELEKKNTLLSDQNEELRIINSKLAESEMQLRESNDIKDKFVSIIGHDLKGPMGSINMLLQVLFKDLDNISKEALTTYAKNILTSAQGISHLLDNLLNWSRAQDGRMESNIEAVDICALMADTVKLFSSKMDAKNIHLEQRKMGFEVYVMADKHMLDFVIRNLIDNAIKFTEPGGKIILSAQDSNSHLVLDISDTGIGIPEEVRASLFKDLIKKQTLGTAGEKGTGLGLVLCYEFVQKMKGQLDLASEVGKGTTFTLTLPFANPEKIQTQSSKEITA